MRVGRAGSTPLVLLAAAVGMALGAGGFAFAHAKGTSYAGDDPATCANCHAMSGHYEGWLKSSHHLAATCNDCHTPAAFPAKYAAKAVNGFHHSKAFTLGGFPDVIRARPETLDVVEARCRLCHADLVAAMTAGGETSCVRCHESAGHLR